MNYFKRNGRGTSLFIRRETDHYNWGISKKSLDLQAVIRLFYVLIAGNLLLLEE